MRARSVWRIERRRFRFGLWVCCFVERSMSAEEAARSSIVSIYTADVNFSFNTPIEHLQGMK